MATGRPGSAHHGSMELGRPTFIQLTINLVQFRFSTACSPVCSRQLKMAPMQPLVKARTEPGKTTSSKEFTIYGSMSLNSPHQRH